MSNFALPKTFPSLFLGVIVFFLLSSSFCAHGLVTPHPSVSVAARPPSSGPRADTFMHQSQGFVSLQVELQEGLGWAPCFYALFGGGMCYDQYGASRDKSKTAGPGGLGDRGCKVVFCPGKSSKAYTFGPCPVDFVKEGASENTDAGSPECYSFCGYHKATCKRNNKYTRASSKDFSNWMSSFHDVPLNKLLVTGAHHSLAALRTLDFDGQMAETDGIRNVLNELNNGIKKIVDVPDQMLTSHLLPMWSSCQASNTLTMLQHGVRMLDFRPYYFTGSSAKPEGLYDYHGAQGPLIVPELQAIKDFLLKNPTEVVYLMVQNILVNGCEKCNPDGQTKVIEALESMFGNCEGAEASGDLMYCGEKDFTKSTAAFAGKVILMSGESELVKKPYVVRSTTGGCNASEHVCGRWYNANDLSELEKKIRGDVTTKSIIAQNPNILNMIQFQLSPTEKDMVGAITQGITGNWQNNANRHGCQSLLCLARVSNAERFFSDAIDKLNVRNNILMLDFADDEGNIEAVIEYNKSLL
eukprot:Nk52_evm11s247 gene=Nk52_evmTU11s247